MLRVLSLFAVIAVWRNACGGTVGSKGEVEREKERRRSEARPSGAVDRRKAIGTLGSRSRRVEGGRRKCEVHGYLPAGIACML